MADGRAECIYAFVHAAGQWTENFGSCVPVISFLSSVRHRLCYCALPSTLLRPFVRPAVYQSSPFLLRHYDLVPHNIVHVIVVKCKLITISPFLRLTKGQNSARHDGQWPADQPQWWWADVLFLLLLLRVPLFRRAGCYAHTATAKSR